MTEIVLSFGDTVLREPDIEILSSSQWLNDTIISFYFEYLSIEVFPSKQDSICFIGPEVTHCLKATPASDLPMFLDPLRAKDMELIFFALNDNRLYSQSGGTHWSLLVFSKQERTMYHLDSMSGSNFKQASQLTAKLLPYLTPDGGDFEELECLQQDNGYDCGIYVLCHAEVIANHFLNSEDSLSKYTAISKFKVSNKRKNILDTIDNLKNKK